MPNTRIADDPFGRDKTVADLMREQSAETPDGIAKDPDEARHMLALAGRAAPRVEVSEEEAAPAFSDPLEAAVVRELAVGAVGRRQDGAAAAVPQRNERTVEDMLRAADTPLTVESVERSIRAVVPHVEGAIARKIAKRIVDDHGGDAE